MKAWVFWRSWVVLLFLLALPIVACDQGETEPPVEPASTEIVDDGSESVETTTDSEEQSAETTDGEDCISTKSFFTQRVWAPILSNKCMMCHNAQGAAKNSKLVLMSPAITGFLDMNYETVKDVAAYQHNGESVLLLKPSAQIAHGGGQLFDADSEDALRRVQAAFRAQLLAVRDDLELPF